MMKKEFTELTSSHIRNAFQQAKENVKARKEEAKKDNKKKPSVPAKHGIRFLFPNDLTKLNFVLISFHLSRSKAFLID